MAHSSLGSSSSSSSDTVVHTCSKECLQSYQSFQKQYDQQREVLNKTNLEIIGYQIGLESLEARIVVHQKYEVVYEEHIAFLKYDVKVRDISITELKNQLEEALKEKDDLKLKLEKFETSSKKLTKLINSQISAKDKTGLGYGSQMNESEVIDNVLDSVFDCHESDGVNNQVNDRFKKGEGYHAVPLPYTGNYMPLRADLSFAGLDDSVFKSTVSETITSMPENETTTSKTSKDSLEKHKTFRSSSPLTEEWESDSEDENVFKPKEVKKIVKPSFEKLNLLVLGIQLLKNLGSSVRRVNHQNKLTHPHPKRNFVPISITTKSGQVPVNAAKQRAVASISTARPVNTVAPKLKVVVSAIEGNGENIVKSSACWIWRPTGNVIDHTSKDSGSYMLKRFNYVDPQGRLKIKGFFDSRCSRRMTGNKFYLSDYQEIAWNKFLTNIASAVICLANNQKFIFSKLIFDAPSTTQPIIEEQIPVTESSSPQNTQSPRQALQEDTQLPQTSMPIPHVADEAVFKEWDDKVMRATTTAASLDAAQASGGYTPGSDGGRPNINELMAICTQLSNRVLALEHSKTAQDLLFKIGTSKRKSLDKEYVSKQGRKSDKTKPMFDDSNFAELDVDNAMENVEGDADTQGRNNVEQITTAGDTVNIAGIDVSTAGPSNVSTAGPSTSTARDIFEDEMITIADTLVAIRRTRPRTTLLIIHDVQEEPRRSSPAPTPQPSSKDKGKAIMMEPKQPLKNPIKARIQRDAEIAQRLQMEDIQARIDADAQLAKRLQQEEREQFIVDKQARMLVDLIAERKRFFAAQRAKQIRNKPPTRTQLRNKMVVKDSRKKDDDNQKQAESSKKRTRAEYDEESIKKHKLEDDVETEELKACLDIVPRDDIAINVESLATKYLIVDWKTHILTENMMYYQIIRADRGSKNYKIFSEMLDDFDRQDVVDLYRLVQERYETTRPEGYDLLLWGDLKTLFKPCKDDEI
ncbi:hypothetical protein Tco_0377929 [Tanacetum coccineum]